MEFDAAKLEAMLDLLVQSGVEEFEGYGFHVRFTERMFTPDKEVAQVPQEPRRPEAHGWKNPHLWPDGKPPEFPK